MSISDDRGLRFAALTMMLAALLALPMACQAAPASDEPVEPSVAAAHSEAAADEAQQDASRMPPPDVKRITAEEAKEHVGEKVMVCGKVALAIYVQDQPRMPTYLNFGRPYPDQVFSVVIRNEDRGNFPQAPETMYADKDVCVTGTIMESETGPQMRLQEPDKIEIQESGTSGS